jgi:hypothetical protein
MTGPTNPQSREVDQFHSRDRHGGAAPKPPEFSALGQWAIASIKNVPRRKQSQRHDTEAKAPLASSAAPVALRQSRILRTIRNDNPHQAANPAALSQSAKT